MKIAAGRYVLIPIESQFPLFKQVLNINICAFNILLLESLTDFENVKIPILLCFKKIILNNIINLIV